MGRLCLREVPIRLLLRGMNQVRKLNSVLDEKDRNIVPDDVPISLFRVQLDGKAAHVARQVG